MKPKLLLALVLSMTLGIAGAANAALIADVQQVNKIFKGYGYAQWSHTVDPDFTVPYDTVNWASLVIVGFGVDSSNNVISIEQNIQLGSLNKGIVSFTLFGLTQYFQAGWGPQNGTFDVQFAYSEPDRRGLAIQSSTLLINYTNVDPPLPTPEPGTMMLLGSGLVGLALYGRKKIRK